MGATLIGEKKKKQTNTKPKLQNQLIDDLSPDLCQRSLFCFLSLLLALLAKLRSHYKIILCRVCLPMVCLDALVYLIFFETQKRDKFREENKKKKLISENYSSVYTSKFVLNAVLPLQCLDVTSNPIYIRIIGI